MEVDQALEDWKRANMGLKKKAEGRLWNDESIPFVGTY